MARIRISTTKIRDHVPHPNVRSWVGIAPPSGFTRIPQPVPASHDDLLLDPVIAQSVNSG
jgi:hypothetical protein